MGPKTGSEIVSARKIPNEFQEATRFTLAISRVEWKNIEKSSELLSLCAYALFYLIFF